MAGLKAAMLAARARRQDAAEQAFEPDARQVASAPEKKAPRRKPAARPKPEVEATGSTPTAEVMFVPTRVAATPEDMERAATLRQAGNNHYAKGELELAQSAYESGLNLRIDDSEEATLLANLGLVLMRQARWPDAFGRCSRALDKDPQNVKARYRRALCLEAMGELRLAAEDARLALQRVSGAEAQQVHALLDRLPVQLEPDEFPVAPAPVTLSYDSSEAINECSDYFRVDTSQADGTFYHPPAETARQIEVPPLPVMEEDDEPTVLESDPFPRGIGQLPVLFDEETLEPIPGPVRESASNPVSTTEVVTAAELAEAEVELRHEHSAQDLAAAQELLEFCSRRREKDDPDLARWRSRWGD